MLIEREMEGAKKKLKATKAKLARLMREGVA